MIQHVDKNSTFYTVYIKNQTYYEKELDGNNLTVSDLKAFGDFAKSVQDSIPELQNLDEYTSRNIVIVPLPSNTQGSNEDTFDKSQLLGVIKTEAHQLCDQEMCGGTLYTMNDKTTYKDSTQDILQLKEKLTKIYEEQKLSSPETKEYVDTLLKDLTFIAQHNGSTSQNDWLAYWSKEGELLNSTTPQTETILQKLMQMKYETVLGIKDKTAE